MEAIGERLKSLIEKKGKTAYEVADSTGISQSTLSRILNFNSKPNSKNRKLLAEYFEVSEDWLVTGLGSSEVLSISDIKTNDPYTLEYSENKHSNTFFKLPNGQYLMTMPLAEYNIQAGFLDHFQDLEYLAEMAQHSIIVDKPVQGRYVAFRVKGDSMDDGSSEAIMQNSIVSCRELQRQHWSSKIRMKDFPVWVIYTTQSIYPLLKEITDHDVDKGIIKCHSLNDAPEYTDFELKINDIQALFYVVNVYKTISKKINY